MQTNKNWDLTIVVMLLVVCSVLLPRALTVICDGFNGFFDDLSESVADVDGAALVFDAFELPVSLDAAFTSRLFRTAPLWTNAPSISASIVAGEDFW